MSTETERAWAAGFFDGEGCTSYVRTSRDERVISMSIGQASGDEYCPEVLCRFYEVVGYGTVNGPYIRENRKPKYVWTATGKEKVTAIYTTLEPYLSSVKKKQFQRAMRMFDEHVGRLSDGMCRKKIHRMEGDNIAYQTVKGKQSRYCRACKAEADRDKADRRRIGRLLCR